MTDRFDRCHNIVNAEMYLSDGFHLELSDGFPVESQHWTEWGRQWKYACDLNPRKMTDGKRNRCWKMLFNTGYLYGAATRHCYYGVIADYYYTKRLKKVKQANGFSSHGAPPLLLITQKSD